MELEISVSDLSRIQNAFEQVTRKIAEGSLVMRAAVIIERQAKENASGRPGPNVQTGRLRASITPEQIDNYSARVGTNVEYAPDVEFGHSQQVGRYVPLSGAFKITKGAFKGRYEMQGGFRLVNPTAPAYPFLGPTIEQTKDQVGNVLVEFGKELGSEWSA